MIGPRVLLLDQDRFGLPPLGLSDQAKPYSFVLRPWLVSVVASCRSFACAQAAYMTVIERIEYSGSVLFILPCFPIVPEAESPAHPRRESAETSPRWHQRQRANQTPAVRGAGPSVTARCHCNT